MSKVTTLSTRFRIYIPKEVREEQGWKVGQQCVFTTQGAGFVMEPTSTVDDLAEFSVNADSNGGHT